MADDEIDVPPSIREIAGLHLEHIATLSAKIYELSLRLRETMAVSTELRRLGAVLGVGPITAGAIMAFTPDLRTLPAAETSRHGSA
ncbi:hypothetical protein MOK15_21340 [Sphingobium sp. BYY-5]|uniref:hypothetical protein n=1 Tax=Sphingobium sp. BYY-5 TaxID=2926400 RepID=UPI001FA7A931|nr:hypothetical protein [Sphingobium sp. BYY-5]MCI4592605.1 hypothetical protein [Sphingobium sp. BYY-5]